MRILRNRFVSAGTIILAAVTVAGFLGPVLFGGQKLFAPFSPPDSQNFLGTDDLGHDVLRDLLSGSLTSLAVGAVVGLASTLIGVGVGALAGFSHFWDRILMRIVDFLLVIPRLPVVIFLAIYLKPSLINVIVILALFGWTSTARAVRPLVAGMRESDFVLAARAIGCSDARIVLRHIVPHLYSVAAVQFVLEARQAVLAEAGLGFLGLEDPTSKSWGLMLSHAFNHDATFTTDAWKWTVVPPTLFLMAFTLGLSLIAVGFETVFNPKLRKMRGQ